MQEIEKHPKFHGWHVKADIVIERIGERPLIIRRYSSCDYCPTVRVDRMNVRTWKRIGYPRYIYAPGVKIVRVSREDWNAHEFMATTTLDRAEIKLIESWSHIH